MSARAKAVRALAASAVLALVVVASTGGYLWRVLYHEPGGMGREEHVHVTVREGVSLRSVA